jgi:hypothetical protein
MAKAISWIQYTLRGTGDVNVQKEKKNLFSEDTFEN